MLPGLGVGVVVFDELVVVEILVGQAGEAVAELMDDNRFELCVVCGREGVGVVDASAAVCVCVGEDYDVFVGEVGENVVQLLEPQCSQIAV